jgi:hypothetical protein
MKSGIMITLTACALFASCRPAKTVQAGSFHTETATTIRDASTASDSLRVLSEEIFKTILKKHLNIIVRQVFYDANHPVDSVTRRPPVVEDRETAITIEMQIDATDSVRKDESAMRQTDTDIRTLIDSKASGRVLEETEVGTSTFQKVLMITGVISIIAIIIYLILKFK